MQRAWGAGRRDSRWVGVAAWCPRDCFSGAEGNERCQSLSPSYLSETLGYYRQVTQGTIDRGLVAPTEYPIGVLPFRDLIAQSFYERLPAEA